MNSVLIKLCEESRTWLLEQPYCQATEHMLGLLQDELFRLGVRDRCQICHGNKGGVPGNENVVEGVVMCDYCSADRMNFDRLKQGE